MTAASTAEFPRTLYRKDGGTIQAVNGSTLASALQAGYSQEKPSVDDLLAAIKQADESAARVQASQAEQITQLRAEVASLKAKLERYEQMWAHVTAIRSLIGGMNGH